MVPTSGPNGEQFVLIACLAGYGNEGTSPAESAQKLIDYRSSTCGGIAWSPDGEPGTAVPPHQYVIARRVERAKQLPQGGDFTLARVGACAGFANQSVFTHRFVRLVSVTPGQFQAPARID